MTLHVPDLAPILARIESIVYEQERRTAGGEPVGAPDTVSNLDDDALDDALTSEYDAACNLIPEDETDAHDRDVARAYLTAVLCDYTDAIAHEHHVQAPKEKTLAALDITRAGEYLRSIITYPGAAMLLDALDEVELIAAEYAHGADAHLDKLNRMTAAADRIGSEFLPVGSADPERTAALVHLNAYLALRASAHADREHDALSRIAAAIDQARAALAARYVESADAAVRLSAEVRRLNRENP